MNKKCTYCSNEKPLTEFVRLKGAIDGYKNECKICHNKRNRIRYQKNSVQERERSKNKYKQLKQDALLAYGERCQCCDESEVSFLTIDHINNDGATHRLNVSGGHNFYQWLKNNNYPSGYQVLCMNCNFSKYTNGGVCVHQISHVKN